MTSPKGDDQKTRIPYEPPRLFDLGGGVAHAAKRHCKPGGSPVGHCQTGGAAAGGKCQAGTVAGRKCQTGGAAGR